MKILLAKKLSLSLCISSALAVPATTALASLTVDLRYATYQDVLVKDVITNQTNTNFLGMRYATPPTGAARFRAARPPAFTAGVQVAGTQPAGCLAAGSGTAPTTPFRELDDESSFDNVFVPGTLGSKKNLPVVFWIYGCAMYPAVLRHSQAMTSCANRAVVVVIQYQLGLFGFLPGQKAKQGGFALQWVQEHITKFGGGPTKVTIWGESAGAGSLPPLFRAAMTSSTFLPSQYAFNDRIPEVCRCPQISAVLWNHCTSAKDSLECLRSVDVSTLQAMNTEINASGFFGIFVFVPVIDLTKLLQQRKINSSTANTVQVPDYILQLFPNIGPAAINAANALYAGLGTKILQVNAIMGETIFICPTLLIMRAFENNAFKFAMPPGTHGENMSFYFPSYAANHSFANPDFDNAFSEAFTDFAMSLNPNIKFDPMNITPLWKPWAGQNEMLFNKTTENQPDVRSITTAKDLIQRCAFWESVSAQTAQ
ncbi:alpha/beta-hydrolase [Pholiota conissans]|uniref:Carboxylic ester hydrolase n=1 Tax=Pholiota conissans TaxID=109636 RepID=A0A9P6CUJ5_9AGAR|nr:alpha/beta-hydrolase [Pholiota conissans]